PIPDPKWTKNAPCISTPAPRRFGSATSMDRYRFLLIRIIRFLLLLSARLFRRPSRKLTRDRFRSGRVRISRSRPRHSRQETVLWLFAQRRVQEHHSCPHVRRHEQKQYSDRLFPTWPTPRFDMRQD